MQHGLILAVVAVGALGVSTVPVAAQDIVFSSPHALKAGREYIAQGKSSKAREVYKRALDSRPNQFLEAKIHNGMCVTYIMDERYKSALKHCNKAIRLTANNWRFYNNRGNIFLKTGKIKEAISDYSRALKMAPKSTVLHQNLEMARVRAGELGIDIETDKTKEQKHNTTQL